VQPVPRSATGRLKMTPQNKKSVSFLKALLSVFSAAIGVQKHKNMERDLNASNPITYVIAGLVFLVIFVGSIVAVVNLVVPG